MPFLTVNGIRFFTFDSLQAHQVPHAIFTRKGGVSPDPWDSLNVGGTVGDDPGRVNQNRLRSLKALERNPLSVYDVWQVHSADVVRVDHPRPVDVPHLKADAMLTQQPGLTLYMRFADCVPIFLYDPVQNVIGIAHAGWQGTVKRVASALVKRFVVEYACQSKNILACIGPSIGPDHYEVRQDVIKQVQSVFGKLSDNLLSTSNGDFSGSGVKFNLWKANQLVLEQAGVEHIEVCEICTACHLEDWFSHRAEAGKTGRFGALIGL